MRPGGKKRGGSFGMEEEDEEDESVEGELMEVR